MPRLLPLSALALALPLAAPAALAQTAAGPIATDRPGFAYNPTVVPQGAFQVETGPLVARTSAGSATTTLVNVPTGLRYGLTPRLELRAASSLYNRASVDAGSASSSDDGFGDVELGAKYQVLVSDGAGPNLSVIPSVLLPIGSGGFTAGDPVLALNTATGLALPGGLGATFVAGATVPTAKGANATANLVGVLGRSFTPSLSGYVEVAAFPTDGATPLYAGAGLAYLVSNTVQLDASLDLGLNGDAADVLGGIGVSIRFGR